MTPVAIRRMVAASRICAVGALAVTLVALAGYVLHAPSLFRVAQGLRGMSSLTAFGIAALAIGTLTVRRGAGRLPLVSISVAMAASVVTLGSHVIHNADYASAWFASLLFGLDPAVTGKTSVATALALMAAGLGLSYRRKNPLLTDIAAGSALVIASTALLGYLYGVDDLYRFFLFNSMALNTAIALALIAVAILFVEPEFGSAAIIGADDAGGVATRRQLSFILLPIIAGGVLLKATNYQQIGPAFAMALLVTVTVVPLAILVLRDGRVLNALDHERRAKIAIQQDLADKMSQRLDAQAAELAHEGEERSKAEAALYRAQRMEAVGQLTGGIAHDFNNLLMAIRGNLELMQHRLPLSEERLHRYLANATAGTDKGAKITAQLLAFSRSQRLDIRAVELEPVLAAGRELIGNALGPTISIHLAFDTAGAWVKTDPDQLELAILNLAVNARDAMPEGGTFRIESSACDASLSNEDDPTNYVSIRAVDTGHGMSSEVSAQAMEPFFTTKERGKGTGLGLAQVYGFVRQCGGDLKIQSTVGVGTIVEILLPCTDPAEAAEDATFTSEPGRGTDAKAGRQVLVIDDDDGVRAVIVEALTSAGFEVIEANDGESGLALLYRNAPAAAVIDFLMPGLNGAEVAKIAQQRQPGLPIVFVSGYSDTVALDGIAGAIVLRKPFDVAGLSRAINSVLH